jgi:dipeptidase E
MGKIVALGGGVFMGKNDNIWPPEMRPIHKEIIALTNKKRPRVLYIPTAADDSEKRITGFQKNYEEMGCVVETLRLVNEHPTKEEIKAKIETADAIFVTGGKTFRMLAKWKRLGIDTMLKQAYQKGTVMSGFSAGAICWFSYGCSDSFSDSPVVAKRKPFKITALGIFDALLCPHYDSEPVRQPALKKIMKRTPGQVAIVLDEFAAIEIIDGKYRFLTAKPTAKARRAYWYKGKYSVEEIKQTKEFQDLKQLLTKPAKSFIRS